MTSIVVALLLLVILPAAAVVLSGLGRAGTERFTISSGADLPNVAVELTPTIGLRSERPVRSPAAMEAEAA